jgi:hypothetical protein
LNFQNEMANVISGVYEGRALYPPALLKKRLTRSVP